MSLGFFLSLVEYPRKQCENVVRKLWSFRVGEPHLSDNLASLILAFRGRLIEI